MADFKIKVEIPEPKTVTDILDEVKHEMCMGYCKYLKECSAAMENGATFCCPLDRL